MRLSRTSGLAATAALSIVAAACSSSGATKLSAASPAGSGQSPPTPIVVVAHNPKYGEILTTASGFALYLYTADEPGGPGCDAACQAISPPLLLPAGETTPVGGPGVTWLGTFPRGERLEVTYAGLPLYTYVADKQPGGVTGQDVLHGAGRWVLATVPPPAMNPAPSPAATAPTTAPPAASPHATAPPATSARVTAPPATSARVTSPAPTSPPATSPHATAPPSTSPPRTSPPTTAPIGLPTY